MSDYLAVIHHRHTEKTAKKNASKSKSNGNFQVKKRVKYENEVIKCQLKLCELCAIPIVYGDRFIPRRYFGQPSAIQNRNSTDENDNDILSMKKLPFYWRMHNYRITIGRELGLHESSRLLNFHDVNTVQPLQSSNEIMYPIKIEHKVPNKSVEALDWPCKPRAKPLAFNDSTHDMPDFDEYVNGNNVIDWSSKGQIAACFEKSLVLWGPPSEEDKEITTEIYEFFHVKALKYSPHGTCLALSMNGITSSLLQIWDVSNKEAIEKVQEFKFAKESPSEAIRCIEWNNLGTHIICGLSTGTVFIISYEGKFENLTLMHRYDGHATSSITNIKYSIHSAYIAVTDSIGNLSILRNTNGFEVNLRNQRAHYVAWHPWNETYLLIGYKSPASIHLLDLKTKTTIAHYRRTDLQYTLCALTINPLSAEVVASFSHEIDHVTHNDILVLASMNRIVDNLSAHHEAVYFILWDPTGTKVATIGQDESLNIWHFFGRSQRKANELIKIHGNVKVPMHSKLNLDNTFMMFR